MTGRLVSVGCSWCHAVVSTDDPAWPTCPECGHRADVARLYCDCGRCRRGESVRILPLDLVDAMVRVDARRVPRRVVEQIRSWGLDPAEFGIASEDDPAADDAGGVDR